MTTTEIDRADTPEPEEIEPTRFARPGPARPEPPAEREDDPPADVPRDQWERPLIVTADGRDIVAYVRASKYGKLIEDYYTLHRWDERNIVWGMSRGRHLVVRAQGVAEQTGRDAVTTLQDIAERAKVIAGADAGALTGTGLHKLSERRDAGHDLSYLDPMTAQCLDAYAELLAPFEVLASETFVVCDALGGAGSFDRVVRLRFPIRWPDGVVWPAGMIVVIDVKTGKISSMPYWACDFSCQQLIYATGVPYLPGITVLDDPSKRSAGNIVAVRDQPGVNGRITWDDIGVPGGPSQEWALICHVPALDPSKAHWERVNLTTAREDAAAAQRAWQRARVGRAERFLALPAEALVPPDGITLAGTDDGIRADGDVPSGQYPSDVDTPMSTSSESIMEARDRQAATAAAKRAETTDALRRRISRADSTDKIDQLYDAWGTSEAWTDELTELCQAGYDRLTPPAEVAECDGCNYDRHQCPACGVNVPHGVGACPACALRVELDEAGSLTTLEALWLAHGPAGDGLWADEHSAAAQAAYDRLTPGSEGPGTEPPEDEDEQRPETDGGPFRGPDHDPAGPPDACPWCATVHEGGPEVCQTVPQDRPGHGVGPVQVGPSAIDGSDRFTDDGPPEAVTAYPCTVGTAELAVTLWCHECLVPAGHPDADDPIAWCDCDSGETCLDARTACRNRAHASDDCAARPTDDLPIEPPTPDELIRGAEIRIEPGSAEPGPFDDTVNLANLRTALDDALTEDRLIALYDAHKPVEDGGDGLWDDECTTRAQAAYERIERATRGTLPDQPDPESEETS